MSASKHVSQPLRPHKSQHSYEWVPYFFFFSVAVINIIINTRNNLGEEGFISLAGYSPSLRETRAGTLAGQELEAEPIEEWCLLACLQDQVQPPFS